MKTSHQLPNSRNLWEKTKFEYSGYFSVFCGFVPSSCLFQHADTANTQNHMLMLWSHSSVRFIFHVVFLLSFLYMSTLTKQALFGGLVKSRQPSLVCFFLFIWIRLIVLMHLHFDWCLVCLYAAKKQNKVCSEIKVNIAIKSASQISHNLPEV